MIRVLHMIGSLEIGGSQAMIMNLYRNIDRTKVQFDFILDHPKNDYFVKEIKSLGGKIYFMPQFYGTNFFDVSKAWNNFFQEHPNYKILHSHVRSYASIYLAIAKKHGVKTIIHSHSTSNGTGLKSIVKRCLQYPLRYQADYLFACSQIAGEWLYGEKAIKGDNFFILNNAINTRKYKVDLATRLRVREQLGVKNNFVFGHVGRLHEAKNHMFLLDLFKSILKQKPESKLVIVGDGELREEIENKIADLELKKNVIMTGSRSDVPELLMAFDAFLFPSKWEGLPVTVVEAQAAELPCFVSDTVTKEVGISDLVHYLPIDKGTACWCDAIMKSDLNKHDVQKKIIEAGFDVQETAQWLTDFYMRIANE